MDGTKLVDFSVIISVLRMARIFFDINDSPKFFHQDFIIYLSVSKWQAVYKQLVNCGYDNSL